MADDAFGDAPFLEAGDDELVRVEERQLQPAVRPDVVAFVRLQLVRRLPEPPRKKLERRRGCEVGRETFGQQVVQRLGRGDEFARVAVALVEDARAEDRFEDAAQRLLAQLHANEFEDGPQPPLRLRGDVVHRLRQQLRLAVVEVVQRVRHLGLGHLQLGAEPPAHVAAADERGKDVVGARLRERGELPGEVAERGRREERAGRVVDVQALRLQRAAHFGEEPVVGEAERGQRLVGPHRRKELRDARGLARARAARDDLLRLERRKPVVGTVREQFDDRPRDRLQPAVQDGQRLQDARKDDGLHLVRHGPRAFVQRRLHRRDAVDQAAPRERRAIRLLLFGEFPPPVDLDIREVARQDGADLRRHVREVERVRAEDAADVAQLRRDVERGERECLLERDQLVGARGDVRGVARHELRGKAHGGRHHRAQLLRERGAQPPPRLRGGHDDEQMRERAGAGGRRAHARREPGGEGVDELDARVQSLGRARHHVTGAAGEPKTVTPGSTFRTTVEPAPTVAPAPIVRRGTTTAPGKTCAPSPIFTAPPSEHCA